CSAPASARPSCQSSARDPSLDTSPSRALRARRASDSSGSPPELPEISVTDECGSSRHDPEGASGGQGAAVEGRLTPLTLYRRLLPRQHGDQRSDARPPSPGCGDFNQSRTPNRGAHLLVRCSRPAPPSHPVRLAASRDRRLTAPTSEPAGAAGTPRPIPYGSRPPG